jgi:hypothetical protein
MVWAPDYITSAELKSYVRIGDTVDDAEIAVAVTASSRAIDEHCNRQFGKVAAAEERLYTARWRGDLNRWVVDIDDLMTTTDLAVEVAGDALTGYTLEPRNAAAKGRPWTRLVVDEDSSVVPTGDAYEVAATAIWGWTAVPTQVKQASYLQSSRFLSRRDSPYGIAGSPDAGSEMRLLARVDPDVAVSLRGLVRPRAVG